MDNEKQPESAETYLANLVADANRCPRCHEGHCDRLQFHVEGVDETETAIVDCLTCTTTYRLGGQPVWFDKFLEVQKRFADVATELSEAWKDGGEFVKAYPFNESFDELVLGIWQWVHESKK